ncbi:MAG: hypothetical protein ACHQ52_04475 [Candidatus Eisenbacteria bacterium]
MGMRVIRFVSAMAAVALAAGVMVAVDVGPGAADGSGFTFPAFVRFGWVSPPSESTTDAHVAEMAAAGLDLMLPSQGDAGDRASQLHRLDLAAAHGMRCIVWDSRFEAFYRWGVDSPEGRARLDSIVADYRDHPGFLAYYMGDEPRAPWALHARIAAALRIRDPAHPVWNNLLGRGSWPDTTAWLAYTRSYLDSIPAAVLCDDHYEFRTDGDAGTFFENASGLRVTAAARGLPFWSVVLLVQHRGYRAITTGMLRWQVANLLAYGCRGIGYFTWWTPTPDTAWDWHDAVIRADGTRTDWYDVVSALDRDAGAVGTRLAAMGWISAQCTEPAPPGADPFRGDDWIAGVEGRATIGRFMDGHGDPFVLCINRDSLARRTLTLRLRGVASTVRLDATTETWMPQIMVPSNGVDAERIVRLPLDPGDFALLRLDGTRGEAVAVVAPRLSSTNTPAHGQVTLALSHLDAGARLELFDAGGRRVREWSPAPGNGVVVWDGTGDGGARIPPGIYLARVRDARGEASARIVWLGR